MASSPEPLSSTAIAGGPQDPEKPRTLMLVGSMRSSPTIIAVAARVNAPATRTPRGYGRSGRAVPALEHPVKDHAHSWDGAAFPPTRVGVAGLASVAHFLEHLLRHGGRRLQPLGVRQPGPAHRLGPFKRFVGEGRP
jgi:hypothetical protein